MIKFLHLVFCGIVVLQCVGCSPSKRDYEATVQDGIRKVRHVDEICRIFSNAPTDHFITQFGFDKSVPVKWNTEVFFGGRYTLTYQIFVSVDYSSNRVVGTTSQPEFYLTEASRVFDASPGIVGAEFSADYKFGEPKWEKVVAAGGDFSVIGITLNTNPLKRFDEYVRSEQEPILHVK
jgi:hypothetical protein